MAYRPEKAILEDRLTNLIRKAKPAPTPEQAAGPELASNRSRTPHLNLAFLTALLHFSAIQVQPQPPTITVNQEPAIQTSDLTENNATRTVIHAHTGFQGYAGRSFFNKGIRSGSIFMAFTKGL